MIVKVLGVVAILVVVRGFLIWNRSDNRFINPLSRQIPEAKLRPLDKYTIDAFAKTKFVASQISLGKVLAANEIIGVLGL